MEATVIKEYKDFKVGMEGFVDEVRKDQDGNLWVKMNIKGTAGSDIEKFYTNAIPAEHLKCEAKCKEIRLPNRRVKVYDGVGHSIGIELIKLDKDAEEIEFYGETAVVESKRGIVRTQFSLSPAAAVALWKLLGERFGE